LVSASAGSNPAAPASFSQWVHQIVTIGVLKRSRSVERFEMAWSLEEPTSDQDFWLRAVFLIEGCVLTQNLPVKMRPWTQETKGAYQ
jgi:hypothetical protein